MNNESINYKKYCPNVFVAECEQQHNKSDIIIIISKYGKENKHFVHNLVKEINGKFYYSITRVDGFNNQERAKNKAERRREWAENAASKSNDYFQKSQKHKDFLILGEPIKVGHHSESRHRKMIDDVNKNIEKSIEFDNKIEEHNKSADYWDNLSNKIDLSMPESLEFFQIQLIKAKEKHKFLKENPDARKYGLELTYANNLVKDLEKKVKIAKILWE